MPKRQQSDVRGIAKTERARDRQAKKAEKLAKRRDAREQRPEPEMRAGNRPPGPGQGR
jgi:hypothetical protein